MGLLNGVVFTFAAAGIVLSGKFDEGLAVTYAFFVLLAGVFQMLVLYAG